MLLHRQRIFFFQELNDTIFLSIFENAANDIAKLITEQPYLWQVTKHFWGAKQNN